MKLKRRVRARYKSSVAHPKEGGARCKRERDHRDEMVMKVKLTVTMKSL